MTTTYQTLDEYIGPGGFRLPQFGILAARPSVGKTSFALNLLRRMRGPRLLLSLEMSNAEVYEQLAKRPIEDPRDLLITDELIMLPHLCDAIEIAGKKLGCKVVILDYINLVQVPGTTTIDNSTMAVVSRELRAACRRAGVALICIAQLNRECENRANPRPRMADLRDSGTLEQDADLILFLYSESYHKPERVGASEDLEVIVAKQRSGPRGVTCWFGFDKANCDIYEVTSRQPKIEVDERFNKQARATGQGRGSSELDGFMER